MHKEIFRYEFKSLLRQPSIYLYAGVLFMMAFITLLGTSGFFDGVSQSDETVRLLNSPLELHKILQYFNKFFLFLLPAIIGMVIYKDYKHQAHAIMYSFPFRKRDYLWGKFASSFSIVIVISLSVALAFILGELVVGTGNPKIGEMNVLGYISAYGLFIIPNLFISGLIVFIVVASTRNIYGGFMAIILLILLQIITENLFVGSPRLLALSDPFGQIAVQYETHLWTLAEQNSLSVPVFGMVMWNRLLWMGIGLTLFLWFYRQFDLTQESFLVLPQLFRKRNSKKVSMAPRISTPVNRDAISYELTAWQKLMRMIRLSLVDLSYIVKNWMFLLLVIFGLFALVFALGRVTNSGDLILLPLTRLMLSVPMFFFTTVIMLITFVFSGMLIHRSRMAHMDQLIDTSPISNWVLLGSKVLALLAMQLLLLLLMMVSGISLQVYNGYDQFEWSLYLFQLFVLSFPVLAIWAAMSVWIHSLTPNVYTGIFLLLLIWIGKDQLFRIGLDSYLFSFNSPPQLVYSDLNGFGHLLSGKYLVDVYWLTASSLLIIMSYLAWIRGFHFSIRERLTIAKQRFRGFLPFATVGCLGLFCLFGFRIVQEERKSQEATEDNQVLQRFKKTFDRYQDTPQAKVVSVYLELDIFPREESFHASGSYVLVNRSQDPIDTLLVRTGFEEETSYSFSTENELIQKDEQMQFAVHLLREPLQVGDSLQFSFEVHNRSNTFFERNSSVLQNGTFLRTDILPRFGYSFRDIPHPEEDSLVYLSSYFSLDADLLDLETIISTDSAQIALAPGYLQREWQEKGRHYYHYRTSNPIKFAAGFNSGQFARKEETYRDIGLAIYHHPSHNHTLDQMMAGLKAAIDYNSRYFSPYQHQEARIIEFPLSEGSYATTMANSIPTSENRFVVQTQDAEDKIDLSFYVPAHELTHQWWGNQLVPAYAQGATMLTESITEYITLQMYEDYYGEKKALQFLKQQRRRYLRGRSQESKGEPPLSLVTAEHEYISYGKGAIVFNRLKHYIGEERLNQLLKQFLLRYHARKMHYPTSMDFVHMLRDSLPQQWQGTIIDGFEHICLYDNSIKEVQTKQLDSGQYETTIHFTIDKSRDGQAVKTFHHELIELGLLDEAGELIAVEQVKITGPDMQHRMISSRMPAQVSLDPHLLLIDKALEDQTKKLPRL